MPKFLTKESKIWTILYLILIPLTIYGGYREALSSDFSNSNADWIFITIAFFTSILIAPVAMLFSHIQKGLKLKKPSWNRGPFRFFTDTLQTLRVTVIAIIANSLGALIAFPQLNEQGKMIVFFHLSHALGLLLGERLVYLIYRKNIITTKIPFVENET
jgi:hypothetical protein